MYDSTKRSFSTSLRTPRFREKSARRFHDSDALCDIESHKNTVYNGNYGATSGSAKCHDVSIPSHRRHDHKTIRVSGRRSYHRVHLLQASAAVLFHLAADHCQRAVWLWPGVCAGRRASHGCLGTFIFQKHLQPDGILVVPLRGTKNSTTNAQHRSDHNTTTRCSSRTGNTYTYAYQPTVFDGSDHHTYAPNQTGSTKISCQAESGSDTHQNNPVTPARTARCSFMVRTNTIHPARRRSIRMDPKLVSPETNSHRQRASRHLQ